MSPYSIYFWKAHFALLLQRHGIENGQFLGLDDSDLSSDPESDVESGMLVGGRRGAVRSRRNDAFFNDNELHEEIIFEENLLDGLPSWLEKLFEGTTTRYHIKYVL